MDPEASISIKDSSKLDKSLPLVLVRDDPSSFFEIALPLDFFVPSSPDASSFNDIRLRSARNSGSLVSTAASSESLSTLTGGAPAFCSELGASAGISIRRGHSISSLIQDFVASETAFRSHGTRLTSSPPPTLTSSAMTGGSGNESTTAP